MATSTRFRSPIKVGRNDQTGNVMLSQVGIFTMPLTTGEAPTSGQLVIPKGAEIESVFLLQDGVTGGTAPTIILGTAADPNGIVTTTTASDGATQVYRGGSTAGALWLDSGPLAAEASLLLAEDTGTEATAGTVRVVVNYWLNSDSVLDASSQ